MAAQPSSSAVRALALEYKSMQEEPVEGFRVKLVNDDNLFEWEVAIFGPPDTLYQGGYFKVIILRLFPSFVDDGLIFLVWCRLKWSFQLIIPILRLQWDFYPKSGIPMFTR